jgi:hypothetical protein
MNSSLSTTPTGASHGALGGVDVSNAALSEVARAAAGRPHARLSGWSADPVARSQELPGASTGGLYRVGGVVEDDGGATAWSVILKVLTSFRHRPLPVPTTAPQSVLTRVRALADEDVTWRHEADLYQAGIDDLLPEGLRLPAVHRVDDLDRVAIWMEDVRAIDAVWDLPRFSRVARALGRLAVRLTRAQGRLPATFSRIPGQMLRLQLLEREMLWMPGLADERVWTHPLVADVADDRLSADLRHLAARLPTLLAGLDRLPHTFVHGDAGPQNLLAPVDDPGSLVAIDWSLIGLSPVGYDLAQLLIGEVHAGHLPASALPEVRAAALEGYCAGLDDEGARIPTAAVSFGLDATLVVRSAFSALPLTRLLGHPAEPPDVGLARLVGERIALTRRLTDLGLSLRT